MTVASSAAVESPPAPPESDFERVCWQLAGFEARLSPEWVDGYLAAVLAGPRAVSVDEWLPALTGELFARVFADPSDERFARGALAARWRELAAQLDPEMLLEDPETIRLEPWLLQFDETDHADFVAGGFGTADEARDQLRSGVAWSRGFRSALADFAADWAAPADLDPDELTRYQAALSRIDALRQPGAGSDCGPDATATRDELIDDACLAVQDLRRWWVAHAPKPTTRRAVPQPGRNEPCPCGSGRKFKRCHGA